MAYAIYQLKWPNNILTIEPMWLYIIVQESEILVYHHVGHNNDDPFATAVC